MWETMRNLIFVSLLIIGAVAGKAQTASSNSPMKRLNINRPSVFITYEKKGGSVPIVESDSPINSKRISLRLHNNTTAPIIVDAYDRFESDKLFTITLWDGAKGFAYPDGAEVDLCYEAEAVPQLTIAEYKAIVVPEQTKSFYSCRWRELRRGKGNTLIRPGHSIVFSLPARFLADNKLKIYTLFNYEWESIKGQMAADEPQHQVYYYAVDLPGRSPLLP